MPGHLQLTCPAQIRQPLLECRRCSHHTHSQLCRMLPTSCHNGMHNTLRTLRLSGLCPRFMFHLTTSAHLYEMQWYLCLSHNGIIRTPISRLLRWIIQPCDWERGLWLFSHREHTPVLELRLLTPHTTIILPGGNSRASPGLPGDPALCHTHTWFRQ